MKHRVTYYILLFSLLCVFSCKDAGREKAVTITTFHGLPSQVRDCGCYFSLSEKDFRNEMYVVATDLDSFAYLHINNNSIRLKLIRSSKEPLTFDERDYENVYSNGLYRLELNIHYKEHTGDDVWWNTGTIRLLFKEIPIYTQPVIGECSCS